MPISLIPGTAGTVQGPGQQQADNPLQGFAEQLLKAKQMQTQEAMQKLTWIAQMTKESGGRFLPDPKEVEKLAKSAGLPGLLTGSGNMFEGMGEAAKKAEGLETRRLESGIAASEASTAASRAQTAQTNLQTEHDTLLNDMEKILSNADETPDRKSSASMILMAGGRLKADEAALMAASPQVRGAAMDAMVKRAAGILTEAQKAQYVAGMAGQTADQFDSIDQARKYWAANINGQEPGPELQPKVTPARLKDQLGVLATAADLGLSPQMTREFIAAGGDTSKIPNWPKEFQTMGMKQLKVMEGQLKVAERGVKVQEDEVFSANALRIAQAWNQLSEAQARMASGQGTNMQDLLRAFEAARQAQLTKNPVSKDIMNKLEDELAAKFGLTPIMTKSLFGLWTSKGYTFDGGIVDEKALDGVDSVKPKGDMGASLGNPEVLGRATIDFLDSLGGAAIGTVNTIANAPTDINRSMMDFFNQYIRGVSSGPSK